MQKNVHAHRIKLAKLKELKFISHLDWQNLILKSLRRAGVKFALSEGFNPMPKVSYSPALPIFIESECELVNFVTVEPLRPDFVEVFQNCISKNVKVLEFELLAPSDKKLESLENIVQWAQYQAILLLNKSEGILNFEDLEYTIDKCLSGDDLFIKKINKKGIEKNINYRSSLHSLELSKDSDRATIIFTLKAGQGSDIPALRADEFLKACFTSSPVFNFDIKRTHLFDKDFKIL